jgi:putative addiction module component (TIGR02574 family)
MFWRFFVFVLNLYMAVDGVRIRTGLRPITQNGGTVMKKISASDIAEMPIEERIQLVEDIWDSISELPEAVSIPEWHKEELERRLDAYHANPTEHAPWSEVREKLLGE